MPSVQKVMRKNFSVSMVNTRSAKENKTKESAEEERTVPATDTDLETPDHSADEMERKTTDSTPMPNVGEQEKKTMEFSPIDIVEDTTSNTPETIKDDSQTKRTSFTEKIAMMVGMKPREKEEVAPTTEKGKTFGTVSSITTGANQNDDQIELGATAKHEATVKNGTAANQEKTTFLELGDLMAKLKQIDKKLKCSEEDRQMLKKEIPYNKSESLDHCFNLAKATEKRLQQMSDKVEALEAFATRSTDSSERGGRKSRNSFKKPKEFKDDSDECIDTWVEVMRLHLEQDNLNDERQACTAILGNLEGPAFKCVVAKKEEERDTADKIFEILLNRFGSGMKGHQAMRRFKKRKQRDDESIDRFLDDLESLRRRSDPEESTNRRNFSIASKFIDGIKNDDLRTRLATYYTLSKDNAPTPEEMRQKSREYMLMKPKKYSYPENRNMQGGVNHRGRHGTSLEMIWTNASHAQIADQWIITWRIARRTSKA